MHLLATGSLELGMGTRLQCRTQPISMPGPIVPRGELLLYDVEFVVLIHLSRLSPYTIATWPQSSWEWNKSLSMWKISPSVITRGNGLPTATTESPSLCCFSTVTRPKKPFGSIWRSSFHSTGGWFLSTCLAMGEPATRLRTTTPERATLRRLTGFVHL